MKKIASAPLAAGLRVMEFPLACHSVVVSAMIICGTIREVLEKQLCPWGPLTITSEQW